MKKIVLTLTIATAIASAGFMSNMSFAYGKDSGKIDKNFVRDNKHEIVKNMENGKIYSDTIASSKMTYSKAVEYCNTMSHLGFSDWKLPNKEELKAIMELGRRDLNVKHAFQNIQEGIYWSSTKDRHDEAWYVDFDLGRYNTASYDHNYYALCVRQGEEHSKSPEAPQKESK